MDETPFSYSSDELSAEDLAIIRMFDEMTDLEVAGGQNDSSKAPAENMLALSNEPSGVENPDDMLMLFASEAEEDIATMRRALLELEQDNHANSPGLVTLGRAAHKLKGTSGAMGCEMMSTIALHIEEEIQLLRDEKITVLTGLSVLVHALKALEMTLQSVVDEGQESPRPLQELRQDLTTLNSADEQTREVTGKQKAVSQEELEPPIAPPVAPFDRRQLHGLISHTERLIELNTPLQGIQKQIAKSLMELQAAYGRLHYLESVLSNMVLAGAQGAEQQDHSGSSLVARILQRTNRQPPPRQRSISAPLVSPGSSEPALWDEMEMDRFTEQKILLQSFSEAVADVATASAQLKTAYAQIDALLEQQARQAMVVRNDALHLRSTPFSTVLARAQHIVQTLAQRHKRIIQFETAGDTTEIDQDILELLAVPLLELIRANVTDSLLSVPLSPLQEPDRIWLAAQTAGNEIVIDLGFSMPIPGGALEALRGPIQQVNGSIAARRNPSGGVVYQLRFPRAQGLIQGLLVQAGGQGLILPLQHIELIDYKRQETQAQLYHLATLLGFPPASGLTNTPPPILLANSQRHVAIQVDEIIGEIELIMRPLDQHLQRPGIVGNAVDATGNVLLVIDLPALMRYTLARRPLPLLHAPLTATPARTSEAVQPATLLVADDSVYIRQSLRQTFERAGYVVVEARDGIEALECLSSDQPPMVMLLDIEMPNLNGYDLLNILHSQPGFVDCKTIMLTSRSSDKHRQRAMELGAYAFLSKPCSQEVLLDTVYKALSNLPAPA
jgi:chemotaxis protein histidine kinase CheA/ActR/RegA family two-component response regulator